MIPKLHPGQEITSALLNQVIDGVNAAQITSSDFPLERTAAGTKLKLARRPQDFYARIIETEGREKDAGDAVKDGEYEWREVYLPGVVNGQYPPDEFENRPDGEGRASYYDADSGKLLEPAYELSNDRTVKADTLVRMRVYPGVYDDVNARGFIRRYVFTQAFPPTPLLLAQAASDWEENGTYPEGNPRIRCYQLIPDPSIPPTETIPHPKMPTGDAIWVELPRERDGGKASTGAGLGHSHSTDPALYAQDKLYYSVDDQDRNICQSPYLHMGKIGEIRMMGMTASGDPEDEIPVGWHECNDVELVGNAGKITLANFARNQQPLGGSPDRYGAIPLHASSDFKVGEPNDLYVFDAHGSTVFARLPFPPPGADIWVDTTTVSAHKHEFKCAQGEYPLETVYFYQRYK